MEWIERLNDTIDYIEEHLTEEIKGERKKEGRIKCKHTSFTLCVCASNKNASIFD